MGNDVTVACTAAHATKARMNRSAEEPEALKMRRRGLVDRDNGEGLARKKQRY